MLRVNFTLSSIIAGVQQSGPEYYAIVCIFIILVLSPESLLLAADYHIMVNSTEPIVFSGKNNKTNLLPKRRV